GTTALVLELIERGEAPALELARPVEAVKSISRDQNYEWIVPLHDGRTISALEIQRLYLEAARKIGNPEDGERSWLLAEWENVLNDLERDVASASDRVDWVAKKFLLSALQEGEGLAWSDPWLQSIDLEYHNIDAEAGLHAELLRQGSMRRIATEEQIEAAIFSPPETTRAYTRGRAVAKFNSAIKSIQWDEVVFARGLGSQRLDLPEPSVEDARVRRLNEAFRDGAELDDLLRIATTA
ncbi:MAG: proteasome accessory factor PafA2 family protein, partial [Verrucomicrobiota bacterium]|nr:proteasome accessory factor PafA2 family protein [Verrucomicrobiota bacterium]